MALRRSELEEIEARLASLRAAIDERQHVQRRLSHERDRLSALEARVGAGRRLPSPAARAPGRKMVAERDACRELCSSLEQRARELDGAPEALMVAALEKEAWVRSHDPAGAAELDRLAERHAATARVRRQVEAAAAAGEGALAALADTERSWARGRGWQRRPLVAGRLVAVMVGRTRREEARPGALAAKNALERFVGACDNLPTEVPTGDDREPPRVDALARSAERWFARALLESAQRGVSERVRHALAGAHHGIGVALDRLSAWRRLLCEQEGELEAHYRLIVGM
jgi:hypothetical protein